MAVFSVGILWHRANETGGLAGLFDFHLQGLGFAFPLHFPLCKPPLCFTYIEPVLKSILSVRL